MQLSFGDGNRYHMIEVTTSSQINEFRSNEQLIQSIENSDEKIFIYKFATKYWGYKKTNKICQQGKNQKYYNWFCISFLINFNPILFAEEKSCLVQKILKIVSIQNL